MATQAADSAIEGGVHAVQFYTRDEELEEAVARYLADGLSSGGAAVVIATAEHRRGVDAELAAAGLDPERLRREEQLVTLDARATLERFMTAGSIDHAAFCRVIGSAIRTLAAPGRAALAFGEMVALLWEAGDVLGAIELEMLWNELQRELSFSLLCGYRSDAVAGHEHAGALEHVCHLHTSVVGRPASRPGRVEISEEFEPSPDAPAAARRLVSLALRGHGHAGTLLVDAQLVVSELATNAVTHARTPFTVRLWCEGSRVGISVADASPLRPLVRDHDPGAGFGRGMRLIGTVADTWDVAPFGDGKVVWAELSA